MTTRTAQCACGRVRVTAENEPALVGACHCDFCQKRTGSVFAANAYFTEVQCVEIKGETKVYKGLSAVGKAIDYHFCTTCGSTVYWTVEQSPGITMIGIAVGNFVDQDFPAPAREYYVKLRHRWVLPIASADQFETFPDQRDRHRSF